MRGKTFTGALAALFVATVAVSPGQALSLDGIGLNTGVLLIGTDQTLPNVAPFPAVGLTFGFSLPISLVGPFFMEPALDIYTMDYTFSGNRAEPATADAGASFLTIGTLVGLQIGARIPFGNTMGMEMSVGMDALLRFPVYPYYNSQSAIDAAASAWGYFFGAEHYLYPETRLSLKWQFMDGVVVVLSLGAFFPLAHLWDGQNLSLLDEFMVKAGLGFTMLLGGTPKPAAEPAAEASPSDPSTPPDEPADSPG